MIRVLLKDYPYRAVALATDNHVLVFRHNPIAKEARASSSSLNSQSAAQHQCIVEFSSVESADLSGYRSLTSLNVQGTLGLVTIGGDIFLCVVNGASKVATIRPGENVQQITSVDFHCINRSDLDHFLLDQVNRAPTDPYDDDYRHGQQTFDHPCIELKKLLSGGTFYYSADFDLTLRLQDRTSDSGTIALDSLDRGFLWNAFMIQPLVNFRSRLSEEERSALDGSRILTSAIRGFAMTITVPAASSPVNTSFSGRASTLTLVSRLSCRRAGTRFNSRGIDDDGNVANFVETETAFWAPTGLCFSYVQVRGSVPVFWEQAAGFTPGQQKISLARSAEATQPAFDRHFDNMETDYGAVHIVNLLSNEKAGEVELTRRYQQHVRNSPLNSRDLGDKAESTGHQLLQETDYDFHAETRAMGYEAASGIKRWLQESAEAFVYYLSEEVEEDPKTGTGEKGMSIRRSVAILEQEGIFRTNCLDCLDRTNLVQTIVSQMALEELLRHRGERRSSPDFWVRHSTLWADNGDALSKIYAGTGALKSSFTRSGKMSLAGALADVRKSATRLYINNFEDKGRQNTIDMLLGRLMGQVPVHLYDPINDYVSTELGKRTGEYTSSKSIHILACTFNLNGKTRGITDDLSSWLCPDPSQQPEIVAVGFQEIVELSPQQIMSTDPNRRVAWEDAVKITLNTNAQSLGSEEYVLLRGGQLVGASLSVFVKASILPLIKNVEGSLKKTGMSGMAGNKGAVAIRMECANTSICLVTAHLAAGFANYEERNQDYRTISHGLRFQRNRSIDDHDTIIWLGDFNYRIGMNNDRCRQLIKAGDIETLYENDQLNLQMVHGKTFTHYNEAKITFLPTYKYDNGTDEYDSSEKARIPAWCDRVLWKGNSVRQLEYDTAPLRFSDHRPVYASFQCPISVIDHKKKSQIHDELYQKRRAAVGDGSAMTAADLSDDDELIDYDSVEPGLPPASSEKRKWWLDGGQKMSPLTKTYTDGAPGLPARSQVRPPGEGYTLNPNRPPNPFGASPEPDWIRIDKPQSSPRATPGPALPARSLPQHERKVPPPSHASPNTAKPQQNPTPPRLPSRSSTISTTSSAPPSRSASARKPAPPVPNKPTPLRSDSVSSTPADLSSRPSSRPQTSNSSTSAITAKETQQSTPSPPPPRRSGVPAPGQKSERQLKTEAVAAGARDAGRPTPPLPPRRVTGGEGGASLMDDGSEGGLKGWEPLKPN